MRKIITDFDNAAIWTDDCAEIFFDARANGISYHCFKVNCIGTRADFRRRDAAVYQNDWSGTDWTARTSIGKDRWTIEAFSPGATCPPKRKRPISGCSATSVMPTPAEILPEPPVRYWADIQARAISAIFTSREQMTLFRRKRYPPCCRVPRKSHGAPWLATP